MQWWWQYWYFMKWKDYKIMLLNELRNTKEMYIELWIKVKKNTKILIVVISGFWDYGWFYFILLYFFLFLWCTRITLVSVLLKTKGNVYSTKVKKKFIDLINIFAPRKTKIFSAHHCITLSQLILQNLYNFQVINFP